ncbi:MAG: cell wall metabolism sensor histidine kinase WalK, partial [Alkalinema sp. CAN_BIN05]|nr:cell wall metabolism sensor histidine kinase WalK [Alkalinema sp. CAN_BIN05]
QLSHSQNYAIVTIQDTGIGITEADLPHLFDRFYRVKQDRSRQTGGVGLGLSIVKAIVQAHGGEISVESELGIGSQFTVRFGCDDRPKN